jgi:hypothetical protein
MVPAEVVEQGGQPLLYLPGRRQEDAEPVTQLAGTESQDQTETWKTLGNSGWAGGPVLAAWPDENRLAQIDGDRRTGALCLLTRADQDAAAWASAHQPEQLSPGASLPPPAAIADPVVEQGMATLTTLVNQSNNLAGVMDHRDAVTVLQLLHDGDHRLDPPSIYAWALAHGWPARGAQRLQKLAAAIAGGKRPRPGVEPALRSDILQVWRDDAESVLQANPD